MIFQFIFFFLLIFCFLLNCDSSSPLSYYVTTIAGNKTSNELKNPSGIWVDSSGQVYIADTGNHVIRIVSSTNSRIFAGSLGNRGYAGKSRNDMLFLD